LGQRIVRDRCLGPYDIDQRRLAHDLAAVFHQEREDLEGLGSECDLFTTTAKKSGLQVQSEFAETVLATRQFSRVVLLHNRIPWRSVVGAEVYTGL
jgi:hypothetical protein